MDKVIKNVEISSLVHIAGYEVIDFSTVSVQPLHIYGPAVLFNGLLAYIDDKGEICVVAGNDNFRMRKEKKE